LTDPIEDWIPEIKGKKVIVDQECTQNCELARREAESQITFRHVLAHTSGLDPSRDDLHMDEIDLLGRKSTLEETIVNRAPLPLAFDPGQRWQYGSSTDYVALLVERVSGRPLKEFLQERIFDPLDMDDTHYVVPDEKRFRVSSVYSPDGPDQTIKLARTNEYSARPLYGGDFYGGVAGLYSTAADYWRFSQMLLNGGELNGTRLLSPKTINLMISNHSGDGDVYIRGPGYSFGLGFGILSNAGEARDPLTPGSFTWGGAWGTIFFIDPVEEMIGIMMTQITSYRHLTVRQDFGVTAMQSVVDSNMPVIGYPVVP
jgi:CubicO group peptidase (beta-lactamase class C family)